MGTVTRETRLNQLPFRVIRQLGYMLDPYDMWQKIVEQVPCYDITDVSNFIRASHTSGKSPFETFIYEWGMKKVKVRHLMEKLMKAELYRAAQYLTEDVLKEEFRMPDVAEILPPAAPHVLGFDKLKLPPKPKRAVENKTDATSEFDTPSADQKITHSNPEQIDFDKLKLPPKPKRAVENKIDTSSQGDTPSPDQKIAHSNTLQQPVYQSLQTDSQSDERHKYSQLNVGQPQSCALQHSSLGGLKGDLDCYAINPPSKIYSSEYQDYITPVQINPSDTMDNTSRVSKVEGQSNDNQETSRNLSKQTDSQFDEGNHGELGDDTQSTSVTMVTEADGKMTSVSDDSMGLGRAETVCIRKNSNHGNRTSMAVAEEQEDRTAELPHNLQSDEPPYCLPFSLLKFITNSFDATPMAEGGNLIGKGGFGSVYYGQLRDGKRLAVKRLESTNRDMDKQFETELKVLQKFQHENLLPLFGYSSDGPSNIIVYEYMSNGSLEDCLECKNGRVPLTVAQRLSITMGTARGIHHLHTFDEVPLIHRDIKSANVLLDDNMTAKVGDFGIARFGEQTDKSFAVTTAVGTSAYMAPEAIREFKASVKLDSFSFGVILLEILTGLPAYDEEREDPDLPSHMMESCEEDDDVVKYLDKRVDGWSHDLACDIYNIAMRCMETKKKLRPTIAEILADIEKISLQYTT